jgi:nicotinamide-nucleotide amidase
MNAEIIAVGTEVLLGDIVNTNAQYLSRRLADLGIYVYYQSVVGDNKERLKNSLKLAYSRADMVITTGGLGPTKDDLTKEVGSEFFQKPLLLHEESLKSIEDYFNKLNRNMTEANKKQAYIPEGAVVLKNNFGTAPGCIIDDSGKILVMLPGPPREMIPMFENHVVPYLKKYQKGVLVSKVIRIIGLGESEIVDNIKDLMDAQTNPTIAPYAKSGEAILRVTASAETEYKANLIIDPVINRIYDILKDNIYAMGDTTIENVVAKELIDKGITISTAESCTGGLLAGRLINYPGISSVFMEGAVTYSNESKMKRLGVKESTLEKYGAVSKETALEMAEGIAKASNTDIGLSTTGIAGPDGGTDEKPVGLVFVGLYINGNTYVKKLHLTGDRENIRNRTVIYSLDFLRRHLLK